MTLYCYKPIQRHWTNLQKFNCYNCLERCINSNYEIFPCLHSQYPVLSEKTRTSKSKGKNATLVYSEIVNRLCPTCSEGVTCCFPISRSTAAAINRHVFWAIRTALSEGQNWDNWHQKQEKVMRILPIKSNLLGNRWLLTLLYDTCRNQSRVVYIHIVVLLVQLYKRIT